MDEIPRLHVLPTEGREYLEGLEVRGREAEMGGGDRGGVGRVAGL